jgi:hypothetical protein
MALLQITSMTIWKTAFPVSQSEMAQHGQFLAVN